LNFIPESVILLDERNNIDEAVDNLNYMLRNHQEQDKKILIRNKSINHE